MRSALILPIAVPPVVLVLAYYATFDRDEYNLRGTALLVLLAHVMIAYPLVLRVVVRAARAVDPRLAEAAAVLGATPRQAWRRIDLPLVSRALIIGALFAFVVSLGELGATILLRRPTYTTAPVAILDGLSAGTPESVAQALALAAVLMTLTVVAFLFIERVGSRDAGEY